MKASLKIKTTTTTTTKNQAVVVTLWKSQTIKYLVATENYTLLFYQVTLKWHQNISTGKKKKRWQKIWFNLWERVQTSSMFVYPHRGMERCSRKSITGWKDFRCFYIWKYLKISVPEIVPCYIICRELICLESSTFIVVSLLWGAKSRFLYLKIFPQEGYVILWKSIESF